jgi:hypothetical protein
MQIACTNIQPHGHLGSNTSIQTSASAIGTAAPKPAMAAMAAVVPAVAYTHIASRYTNSLPRTSVTPSSRKVSALKADVVTLDPADAEEAATGPASGGRRVLVRPSGHRSPLWAE